MSVVDLTGLRGYLTWHRQIHRLKPGAELSVLAQIGDSQIISNGICTAVEGEGVWADLPRIEVGVRLLKMAGRFQAINDGKPYRKDWLRQGQAVHVMERYAGGPSCQVSGTFVTGGGDYFIVDRQKFELGAKQGGKRRQLRVMT